MACQSRREPRPDLQNQPRTRTITLTKTHRTRALHAHDLGVMAALRELEVARVAHHRAHLKEKISIMPSIIPLRGEDRARSRVGGRSTPLLWARGRGSAIIWGCGRPACLLSACWLACSPSSSAAPTFTPARRAGRSGGHWACRGCGSMAIGGHGHVHACVPQGRRKDACYWTMTKHHFGRCTCLSSLGLVWTHPMKHRLSATQRANV